MIDVFISIIFSSVKYPPNITKGLGTALTGGDLAAPDQLVAPGWTMWDRGMGIDFKMPRHATVVDWVWFSIFSRSLGSFWTSSYDESYKRKVVCKVVLNDNNPKCFKNKGLFLTFTSRWGLLVLLKGCTDSIALYKLLPKKFHRSFQCSHRPRLWNIIY